MSIATHLARWRPLLTLLAMAGIALPLRAADAPAGSPAPAVTGSATAPSAMPSATPAGRLPGNDPSLFANSIPTNTGPAVSGPAPDAPSTSFAVNLLKRLVKRGILTQDDADELTREAQTDAANARAQAQADAAAASQAVVAQVTEKAAEMTPPPPTDDEVRVPFVPDNVKEEIER